GFGFTNRNRSLFALAFVAFVLFGILDVYYLFLERKFRKNFNRLAQILSGYGNSEDEHWLEKMKGNFVKPETDQSTRFLKQLPDTITSWSNLPYLITFLITILLLIVPLPPK
ncbi:MAG: hypothetical protein ACYT04_49660, partial [Nostoc sp.]